MKQPTTLRQMQRKLQADKEATEMKRWLKKHPHSQEALEAADKAYARALLKIEEQTRADARREARLARRLQREARITHVWLKASFELDQTVPGGLRRHESCTDGKVTEVKGSTGTFWRVVRSFAGLTVSMSIKQACAAISPPSKPKQRSDEEKRTRAEQQKIRRTKNKQ
jgi:hypothetical protein